MHHVNTINIRTTDIRNVKGGGRIDRQASHHSVSLPLHAGT
jgi:hypothetical protein